MGEEIRLNSGVVSWRSPSNIALVKYWGKKPGQIPANPSFSMTLSRAFTDMTMEFQPKDEKTGAPCLEFLFEGKRNEKFENKIAGYLQSLFSAYPVLQKYHFKLSSANTFPHSTGIASSASSMSALGLCLAELLSVSGSSVQFFREASRMARLASGSACRSVYGGFVLWGSMKQIEGTSDEYAIPVPFDIHPSFSDMKDAILIVSSREKDVSSRAGHALMEGHPYASQRYETAIKNTLELADSLQTGDFDKFISITESEALNLHALMMTSSPSYLLIEPDTINIIHAIKRFREQTSIPVCFTLDAGPNIHMLYPAANKSVVKNWIADELVNYCENERWIDDVIGNGPEKIVI